MKEKIHNYLYRITNTLNNMEYIGVHSTNDLNDGYFGSGTYLKFAVKKYNRENFTKEIISIFNTRDEALLAEKQAVTGKYIQKKKVYNLVTGGGYPFDRRLTASKFDKKILLQRVIDFNNPDNEWDNYITDIPINKRLLFYSDEDEFRKLISNSARQYPEQFKELRLKFAELLLGQSNNMARCLTLCYNNTIHRKEAKRILANLYEYGILGTGIKYKAIA